MARPAAWVLGLAPLAVLAVRGVGVDPIETLTHHTGWWALALLLASLAVTPLRRLTGWNGIIAARRVLGLFAFLYAVLHFMVYLADHGLDVGVIAADVVEHPWVTVGFAALLLLIPLALTSRQAAIRRMGKRWQKLHRLVYLAAGLGVLHFFLLVKKDVTEPLAFAAAFAVLMAFRRDLLKRRVPAAREPRRAGPASPAPRGDRHG